MFFKDYYNFNERNPRTQDLLNIGRSSYNILLNKQQFRKKFEMEKRKIKRVIYSKLKIGEDDDDDDELDDNDDRVYKDSGGNTIPTFKPNKDGASNRITEGSYDLNGL